MAKKAEKSGTDEKSRSILINFVLDKSGSMSIIRDATIAGFNEFKNDQAAEEGDAYFTLTLFDTEFFTVAEAVPIREVPDLDFATYPTDGCTALFDAIGHTMRITDDFVAAHKPDQVLFVIMTDGEENSSQEFTHTSIFQLIQERQEKANYEFIYLGANQDSYAVGEGIGLRSGRMLDYAHTAAGAKEAMRKASHNVRAHRRYGDKMRDAFFSEALEDVGSIDSETWKAMSAEERERRLEDGKQNSV